MICANMTQRLCFGLMLMGLLSSMGCVRSLNPIIKDDQVVTDKELAGDWVSRDEHNPIEFKVTTVGTGFTLTLKHLDSGQLVGRMGKVGELTLVEATIEPDELMPGMPTEYASFVMPVYSFAVMEKVAADHIRLRALDAEWLAEYVKAHPEELAVATRSMGIDSMLVITASTDQYQAFILTHAKDEKAWTSWGDFYRPDDPATRPAPGDAATTRPVRTLRSR